MYDDNLEFNSAPEHTDFLTTASFFLIFTVVLYKLKCFSIGTVSYPLARESKTKILYSKKLTFFCIYLFVSYICIIACKNLSINIKYVN